MSHFISLHDTMKRTVTKESFKMVTWIIYPKVIFCEITGRNIYRVVLVEMLKKKKITVINKLATFFTHASTNISSNITFIDIRCIKQPLQPSTFFFYHVAHKAHLTISTSFFCVRYDMTDKTYLYLINMDMLLKQALDAFRFF